MRAGLPFLTVPRFSRDKGRRGEQEVVKLTETYGLRARRDAPLQAGRAGGADVTILAHPALHIEVKRDEKMSVDAMVRQAEADAKGGTPIVFWRRNRRGWRADVPLTLFLELLSKVTE